MSFPLLAKSPVISLTVYGKPQPQGSSRAFTPKGWSRPIITSDNTKLKPWRQQISGIAMAITSELNLPTPTFGEHVPVEVVLRCYFSRPKSAKKRPAMTTKPDADKLLRACLDSLTGIAFKDDSQVIEFNVRKMYLTSGPERIEVEIREAII